MFNSSFVNIGILLEMILNIFLALGKIWKKPRADIFNVIQTQTTYSQQNNKLWEVDGQSKRVETLYMYILSAPWWGTFIKSSLKACNSYQVSNLPNFYKIYLQQSNNSQYFNKYW